jgi:lipoate-protein ligase A
VLAALAALGVTAEASGRNDLVVKTAEGDQNLRFRLSRNP